MRWYRFFRAVGAWFSILLFAWRYYHFPASYPRVAEPIVVFMFAAAEVVDFVIYPFVYASLEKGTKEKST